MPITRRSVRSLILAVAFWVAALPAGAMADEPVARVLTIAGAVNILREGGAQAVGPGTALQVGDQVVTGADSRVRIAFADGSTVTLGDSTILAISAFAGDGSADPARAALDLITGIVRLVTRAQREGFEVRTRAAVASVRGTRWIVASEPGRDSVFVIEGRVDVRGRRADGRVTLAAGEGTDIDLDAAPTRPSRWGAARVEDVMSRTRAP